MSLLQNLVLVLHVLAAIAICGFVLLQHGKGADMGAAFGGGSSGSLFGASGSANFLSRTTAILAALFFATSVALTWFGAQHGAPVGVMEKAAAEQSAAPVPPAAQAPADAAGKSAPAGEAGPSGSSQVPGAVPAAGGQTSPVRAEAAPAKTGAGEVPK